MLSNWLVPAGLTFLLPRRIKLVLTSRRFHRQHVKKPQRSPGNAAVPRASSRPVSLAPGPLAASTAAVPAQPEPQSSTTRPPTNTGGLRGVYRGQPDPAPRPRADAAPRAPGPAPGREGRGARPRRPYVLGGERRDVPDEAPEPGGGRHPAGAAGAPRAGPRVVLPQQPGQGAQCPLHHVAHAGPAAPGRDGPGRPFPGRGGRRGRPSGAGEPLPGPRPAAAGPGGGAGAPRWERAGPGVCRARSRGTEPGHRAMARGGGTERGPEGARPGPAAEAGRPQPAGLLCQHHRTKTFHEGVERAACGSLSQNQFGSDLRDR